MNFLTNVTREKLLLIFALVFLKLNDGKAQEKWTQYKYPDGKISSEGNIRNGKPDGYWKTYYTDGGLKTEGNRKNFLLDSTWKFYREDSTLEHVITYREDLKNGVEQFFDEKGKLREQYTNVNNIREGNALFYYDTGELQRSVTFSNNKEEGKGKEFDKDGRIITLLTYRNGFIYSSEKINRYNPDGKRTGVWQDLYPNGIIKEDGNWTNGLRNGVFKFFNKKGELERMEQYEDGKLVEGGSEAAILDIRKDFYDNGKVKSIGSYRDGRKQGTFREYDQNGNETGAVIFDNDLIIGEGKMDSIGRRQGDWKIYYPTGEIRSTGAYKDGKKEGQWVYFFRNGKTEQKGNYKDDLATGAWKWFFEDGSSHREEIYRKGREDGHAIEYDSLGMVINEGDYVDGLKTGFWKLTVNDHTEEGEYADGELNGVWIWKYNDNGQRAFEGEFQNGLATGKHRYWYRNGNLKMKGSYEGGELNGLWEYYSEEGLPEMQIEYNLGIAEKINGQKIKLPENKEQ